MNSLKCIKCSIELEDGYPFMSIVANPHIKGYLCKKCKNKFDENFYNYEPKQTKGKK